MSFNAPAKPTTSPATADAILPADAQDTISSVSWSPTANHLAAASWDGSVRVYDVAQNGTARGLATLKADGPLLSCDWSKVSL
jgi:mRNA export factor